VTAPVWPQVQEWMEGGTKLFLRQVHGLTRGQWDQPSALAGWSRRHLVAHVYYNARALTRLVSWAATGVESRMYESADQRTAEIEAGAREAPGTLLALADESAAQLAKAMEALSAEAWAAEVVTAQGRVVSATEIPWLRAREVMIHSVDLALGTTFEDLPADFVAALVVDVAQKRGTGPEGPALAAWLTGRAEQAPSLGRWL
jgi:maleylpyruvate isomerase